MPDPIPQSAINVFHGLTGDGLNRVEEAEQACRDNPLATAAIPELKARVAAEFIDCGCSECGSWDGLSRRCSCGNRRVYWLWDDGRYWRPEVY